MQAVSGGLKAVVNGGVRRQIRLCGGTSIQQACRGRVQTRPLLTSATLSQTQSLGETEPPQPTSPGHDDVGTQRWELGRKKLAAIMGADPGSFSEKAVSEALRYLLPTRLTATDAWPQLKHPSKVLDKRKESAFDASGRPQEPAFYTGFPAYHNLIYQIYQMEQELDSQQPTAGGGQEGSGVEEGSGGGEGSGVKEGSGVRSELHKFWVKRRTLANIIAEEISEQQYRELVSRLARLARHPRAAAVTDFLDKFRRPHFAHHGSSTSPQPNVHGQIQAVGRRKTSVAIVHVKQGEGRVTVNSEPLLSYFPLLEQRQQVLFPLVATGMLGGVEVSARVKGGGKTGQTGAIRLAISKALLGLPGQHHRVLEEAGLLVRDSRVVERKKPGQKKARKKFAWVKR